MIDTAPVLSETMKHFTTTVKLSTLVLLFIAAALSTEADQYQTPRTTVQIISEVTHMIPGQPFRAGVLFRMQPDWHIYWKNPGDAGLAPSFKWRLPEKFSVKELPWPYPETIIVGGLANFGYKDSVLIPVQIIPPAGLEPGRNVEIGVDLDWLVCREACIPESAQLGIELPVADKPAAEDRRWRGLFNRTTKMQPVNDIGWKISAAIDDTCLILRMAAPKWLTEMPEQIRYYPLGEAVIENAAPQRLQITGKNLTLRIHRDLLTGIISDSVSGVLVCEKGWRGAGSGKALYFHTRVSKQAER
jgi:DsbC/DsbD-like thiol-disulfide interchange protein